MVERKTWRALILAGLVAVFVVIALLAPLGEWVDALANPRFWRGPEGVVLFIGLYIVWNFALPPAPLQALAGIYYGLDGGLVVIALSATLANAVSHGLARWLGREWVAERVEESSRLAAMEHAVERMGWKGVALLRLSNLIPSNFANLVLGVTSLSLATILWASIVGSLPGWALMLTLAHGGSVLIEGGDLDTVQWIIYSLSAAGALGLLVGFGWYARRVFRAESEGD